MYNTHFIYIYTRQKYKNTKCFTDPAFAIFWKSGGFKDIEYDILIQSTFFWSTRPDQTRPDHGGHTILAEFNVLSLAFL